MHGKAYAITEALGATHTTVVPVALMSYQTLNAFTICLNCLVELRQMNALHTPGVADCYKDWIAVAVHPETEQLANALMQEARVDGVEIILQ